MFEFSVIEEQLVTPKYSSLILSLDHFSLLDTSYQSLSFYQHICLALKLTDQVEPIINTGGRQLHIHINNRCFVN